MQRPSSLMVTSTFAGGVRYTPSGNEAAEIIRQMPGVGCTERKTVEVGQPFQADTGADVRNELLAVINGVEDARS